MIRSFLISIALLFPTKSKADLFGGDLALLAEIVFNTLHTMRELEKQSRYLQDELAGIKDRIHRVQTIANLVQPSEWDKWKDPREAINRIRQIYHVIPKEYRSEKSDQIEQELSKAFNLIGKMAPESATSFKSGKELERRGADSSPGVATKLTASGIGTLIALESQTQVIQSHMTSLLAQMLAEGNEKETRAIAARGNSMRGFSKSLQSQDRAFSSIVLGLGLL